MNTQTSQTEEKMPSDNSDQRRAAKQQQVGAPPPEPEHLRCPRCDSTNTKFCYYNNYNFSQPRHFCKSCRRYWTHGGTLRDIPVGGGSRKNAKRSRTIPSSSSGGATNAAAAHAFSPAAISAHDFRHIPSAAPSSFLFPLGSDHGGSVPFPGDMVKPGLNVCGSFTSLLNTQGPGLLALGGFGLGVGVGPGIDDMGYSFGRAVWPFPGVAEGGANGGGGAVLSGGTWQLGSGENAFVNGDCFGLPDLAISTQGNGMK